MTRVESAWSRHPDYRIDIVPHRGRARVWHGDVLLADSTSCLLVDEQDHVPRLYFPRYDVRLELLRPTDHHSVCPFKGRADYWSLGGGDAALENVVWAYPAPFPEMAALDGHVCFYEDRVRVELLEEWADGDISTSRFPVWGDASDLLRLLDVEQVGNHHFVGPAHRTARNVVEGSHLLAQAVVAASKTLPEQRVTSAFMTFPKAASFDDPVDFHVEVLRRGGTFSTVSVRAEQGGVLRAPALLLMDSGAPDLFHHRPGLPPVAGPGRSEPYDMRVTGREVRIVDGAYSPDPDRVGPPELNAWVRFRDDPGERHLRQALVAQATGHWTIAAAMLPHPGFGEADAHISLSTGVMSIAIAFHDEAPVTDWFLYANPAVYAGAGLAQGDGRVFGRDGRLMASYAVQAMIRPFPRDPAIPGLDATNAL